MWLGISVLLGGMGLGCLLMSLSFSRPWLLLFGASALSLSVQLVIVIERHGLLAFLPSGTHSLFSRSLFELLHTFLSKVTMIGCSVVRIGMLACMDLDDAQSRELLEGLDPVLRKAFFHQPLQQLLPGTVQRLLFGRERRPASGTAFAMEQSLASALQKPSHEEMLQHSNASRGLHVSISAGGGDEAGGSNQGLRHRGTAASSSKLQNLESSLLPCGVSAEDILDQVRDMKATADKSQANATYSTLEKILSAKAAGTAVGAARSLVEPVAVKAVETASLGRAKVSELGESAQRVAANPKAQVTAASAVGGAVTLGASGGATGLVSGGLVGAALGLVPAVFTFGLSIPVGAALGGGTGLCVGSAVGSTAGFVGGGIAGYKLSGQNEDKRDQMKVSLEDKPEQEEFSLSGCDPVLTEVPAS